MIRQVVDQVPDAATVATIHGVVASASHTLLGIPRYDSIGPLRPSSITCAPRRRRCGTPTKRSPTLCAITEESVKAGGDGVYYAALGGEAGRFHGRGARQYIAPLDQMVIPGGPMTGEKFRDPPTCATPRWKLDGSKITAATWSTGGIQEKAACPCLDGHKLFPDQVLLGGPQQSARTADRGKAEALEREIHQIIAGGGRAAAVCFGE